MQNISNICDKKIKIIIKKNIILLNIRCNILLSRVIRVLINIKKNNENIKFVGRSIIYIKKKLYFYKNITYIYHSIKLKK